ncbi:MAG: homogentisate 1,2-dioxygenase [Cryobacterium sp.]|nr:homogentisate 1,2-dioxygenase [Oligoflexia bacterium]
MRNQNKARSPSKYLSGFGNHFSTEAKEGALPRDQNSPQKPLFGLYAEQLSGSAFTVPRAQNLSSWLYRLRPSVMHGPFAPLRELTQTTFFNPKHLDPNQMRWNSYPEDAESASVSATDFVTSIRTLAGTGPALSAVREQRGLHIHLYCFGTLMVDRFFMNADSDFLFVPEQGALEVRTELGSLDVSPGEICVIPRGMKFQINPFETDGLSCRGYIAENFGQPFRLPELGPIGANGLAHSRHFLTPVAEYENKAGDFELIAKFGGELWGAKIEHSPFDVVAWHGNYVPYKYDLAKFNTVNTVSFDHLDPSIFTVLTSPSETPGVANVDFVIFPPRWMVAENTFRPPYFHRNCMSEYMGLIRGVYDAKTAGGFVPGGGSLHNFYSAHGPDSESHRKASVSELTPVKLEDTLAFMFESRAPLLVTDFAKKEAFLQRDYLSHWRTFIPGNP